MSVYFARLGDSDVIKIGSSQNVEKRLYQLSRQYGKMTLIREADGGVLAERWFHHQFRFNRIKGELFTFSEAMLTLHRKKKRKIEHTPVELINAIHEKYNIKFSDIARELGIPRHHLQNLRLSFGYYWRGEDYHNLRKNVIPIVDKLLVFLKTGHPNATHANP